MSPSASSARRYDIDWLRVLAILTVFIFHSGRFFDTGGWHVKNPSTYFGVQMWTVFLAQWLMPLIFVISGASIFFALSSRGNGQFVKDKALRLLLPLVVGIFTHIALGVYLERITHHQFAGSFFDFYPHYFEGLYGFGGNFAWMGLHLWYLEILFIFSLLFLPLFVWLKRGSGRRLMDGFAALLAKSRLIYLLGLPIVVLLNVLDPRAPLGRTDFGGWSLVIYVIFFLYGFILASSEQLQLTIQRLRWFSLEAGGILGVALALTWGSSGTDPVFGTPGYALIFSMFGLSAWCWIQAILGFGMKHLNVNTPLLRRANEAVLPFYVMHQTVLLCVGFFVTQWPIPDFLKAVIISASSLVIILGLYEFLIRRHNLLRFLFGMKPLRSAPLSQQQAPVPVVGA
jgi:glucan biosynthesis protein C